MTSTTLPRFEGYPSRKITDCANHLVVEEHVEIAQNLWPQHVEALDAPNYSLHDLAYLDERIEANLQGIVIAGRDGLAACERELDMSEPAGPFVMFSISRYLNAEEKLMEAVLASVADPILLPGVASAMGWVPIDIISECIHLFGRSQNPMIVWLALEATMAHRQPESATPLVESALRTDDPKLQSQAARAVGVLGLEGVAQRLTPMLYHPDQRCRYAAAWSILRLAKGSNPQALQVIDTFAVDTDSELSDIALVASIRFRRDKAFKSFQKLMDRIDPPRKYAAAAAIGDPALVDGLIAACADERVAPYAGNAVSLITGVDLEYSDLDRDKPASPEEPAEHDTSEAESDDTNRIDLEEIDDDRTELPLPDPDRLQVWWNENRSHFESGKRYLAGHPISVEGLQRVLVQGTQQARQAAALELGLLCTGPLENVEAPGFRQAVNYLGWWHN